MTDSSDTSEPTESRATRVTIQQRLDEYSPAPDYVRGAKYANLLLDEGIEKGDVVDAIPLDRVGPAFFARVEAERGLDPAADPLYAEFKRNPDIICLRDRDSLPDEFDPASVGGGGGR